MTPVMKYNAAMGLTVIKKESFLRHRILETPVYKIWWLLVERMGITRTKYLSSRLENHNHCANVDIFHISQEFVDDIHFLAICYE